MTLKIFFLVLAMFFSLFSENSIISKDVMFMPSAAMPKEGYSEFGFQTVGFVKNETEFMFNNSLFLVHSFTDNINYGLFVRDNKTYYHRFQGRFFSYESPSGIFLHSVAFGAMNIGYNQKTHESSEPVYQFFSAYSLELPKLGLFCHVAVAEDKKRPNESVVSFAFSKSFKLASLFFECDKNFSDLGIKYRFKKGNAIMVSVSPTPVGSRSLQPFYLSFRYSMSENKRRKYVNSMKDSSSFSGLDSRRKTVSSSIQPKLSNERSIVINKSLEYMQKGLEAYSKKDFESALDNYHKVVELTPQFYLGYVRLGSIYYRINQIEQAKKMWRKALEINPRMDELRNALSSLLNSESNNQKLNFSLEDLQ